MNKAGRRGRRLTGAILVGVLGIGASACSSGPSAAAKGLCNSVFSTRPPPNVAVAIKTQTIEDGENSGNPNLDQGARNWIKSLNQHNTVAESIAEKQIVATCSRLGIPLGAFGPPDDQASQINVVRVGVTSHTAGYAMTPFTLGSDRFSWLHPLDRTPFSSSGQRSITVP